MVLNYFPADAKLTCIIPTISYCESGCLAPERNARFFLLKCRYTTFCVVITALTLMHKPLALS